jgi:ABC-type multidrug transport system fused ATPase/permease subunit
MMSGSTVWLSDRANGSNMELYRAESSLNYLNAILRPLTGFVAQLPIIPILGGGAYLMTAGITTLGALVASLRFFEKLLAPALRVSTETHLVQGANAAASRLLELEMQPSSTQRVARSAFPKSRPIQLEIQSVSLEYVPGVPVLRNITVSIRAGTCLGVAGRSGSGKTSLLSLLSGLFVPGSGTILFGGVPVTAIDPAELRSNLGILQQEVLLVPGSIRENLCLGIPSSDEALLEACSVCGFREVMDQHGLGFDSPITAASEGAEGATSLSLGEAQLLQVCRLYLRNPALLLLDEPTAHFDPILEQRVFGALGTLMRGRTCILVAHRRELLELCDRVVILEDGILVSRPLSIFN